MPQPVDVLLGTTFEGRYRIEAAIGRGGMGTVYRATQLPVGRPVALKVMLTSMASDMRAVARFQQEARAIAALKHPNVVRLIDFGTTDEGASYLVMEFLEGESLQTLLTREAPLAPERAQGFLQQVLEVLVEAHDGAIVHRDLKPENLFVQAIPGKRDYLRVLDFGLAKMAAGDDQGRLTGTNAIVGSPRYMSPEQCSGQEISPQTDLYSLGVIGYEMLSGRVPFNQTSTNALLLAHVGEVPRPLELGPNPQAQRLGALVMRCLAKDPAARPASAADALAMLTATTASASSDVHPPRPGVLPHSAATQVEAPGLDTDISTSPTRAESSRTRPRWLLPLLGIIIAAGVAVAVTATGSSEPTASRGTETTESAFGRAVEPPAAQALAGIGDVRDDTTTTDRNAADEVDAPAAALSDSTPDATAVEPSAEVTPVSVSGDVTEASTATFVVTVEASPSTARLSIGPKTLGIGTAEVRWTSADAPPSVVVARAGYSTEVLRLRPEDSGRSMTVTLEPLRPTAKPKTDVPPAKPPPSTQPDAYERPW